MCNDMSDNKIEQLHSGSLICLSQVLFQIEFNKTKSCYQLIIKIKKFLRKEKIARSWKKKGKLKSRL